MTERDTDGLLRTIFATLFRVDATTLTDGSRRGELPGWDSLAHLDLVAELESGFGIVIDPDRALEIESFGDARRVVRELLGDG